MKKALLMAVVAMMAATSACAQNGYNDTRHEVAVSLGAGSNSDIINTFEAVGAAMFGITLENESFIGPISAEYFYHVKPWLGVGGIFVYGQMTQDAYFTGKSNGKDGEYKNHYFTLMPAVKFDWLRKKYFGMYSKLAFGTTLRNEKADYESPEKEGYNETKFEVNWQISLLGLEAGSERLRGFLELGTGEQGIGLIGLRYKF